MNNSQGGDFKASDQIGQRELGTEPGQCCSDTSHELPPLVVCSSAGLIRPLHTVCFLPGGAALSPEIKEA